MDRKLIKLSVNGKTRELHVRPNDLLLNILRDKLGLMGTKYGCGIGECGACTVLMNGESVLSCVILAVTAEGKEITTVEGLGGYDNLQPLQEQFVKHGAVQCGFCTSGMLMTATALLSETENPGEEEIREYLRGNLCRCTGYAAIVKAVQAAAADA